MKPLTVEHVIRLHSQLIEATGGLGVLRIRGLFPLRLQLFFQLILVLKNTLPLRKKLQDFVTHL